MKSRHALGLDVLGTASWLLTEFRQFLPLSSVGLRTLLSFSVSLKPVKMSTGIAIERVSHSLGILLCRLWLFSLSLQEVMVHPGAFQGARKEFLIGEKAAFTSAVDGGYVKDALAVIQRRYLKCFPIDLPHDQEPTPEKLAAVNDEEPEPEHEPPDEEAMTPEEYEAAMKDFKDRQQLLQFRKAQIKCWLFYQYMKDHDLESRDSGSQASLHTLLSKLTNGKAGRPRLKTASNIWRRDHQDEIEFETKRRALKALTPKNKVAALRESVASELFAKADEAEKARCKQIAEAEHNAAIADWKAKMDGKFSTKVEDHQRAIDGIAGFMRPILEGVCEATGWKASLTIGGPEPAMGGRLNTLSLHVGHAPGDIKMTYGRAERASFKKHTLPSFGRFLRSCYSIEECRVAALPVDEQTERPELSEDDPTVTLFQIDALETEPSPNDSMTISSKETHRGDAPSNTSLPITHNNPMTILSKEAQPEDAPFNASLPTVHNDPLQSAAVPQIKNSPSDHAEVDVEMAPPTTSAPHVSKQSNHIRSSPPPDLEGTMPPSSPPRERPLPDRSGTLDPCSAPHPIEEPVSVDINCPQAAPTKAPDDAQSNGYPPSHAPAPPRGDIEHPQPQVNLLLANTLPEPNMPSCTASSGLAIATPDIASRPEIPNPDVNGHDMTTAPPSAPPTPSDVPAVQQAEAQTSQDAAQSFVGPNTMQPFIEPLSPSSDGHSSSSSSASSNFGTPPPESSPPSTVSGSPPPRITLHAPRRSKRTCDCPLTSGHELGAQRAVARPVKRPRRSSVSSRADTDSYAESCPAAAIICTTPTDAPDYMWKSLKLYDDAELGDDWHNLVKVWTAFEVGEGYQHRKALRRTGRPAAVQEWINQKRSPEWRPKITNPAHYALQFQYWWTDLQPDWRVSPTGYLIPDKVDGDWTELWLPGPNGIVNIMTALYFFGLLALKHPELKADWTAAVQDCERAFAKL